RNMAGAAILAAVAIVPDLDLLAHAHREATHSVGAALIAGAIAWSACAPTAFRRDAARWAAAVSLAWGSHVLLDWMSNDTRPPLGVMALWPFTHQYYKASFEVFPAISRRYWLSEFWVYNVWALSVEIVVLLPVTALVVSMYRSRGRSSVPG